MGKTVECGSCEELFTINEDSIFTEKKKIYPGEDKKQKGRFLNQLSRDSSSRTYTKEQTQPESFQKANYAKASNFDKILPTSGGEKCAIIAGLFLLTFLTLFFFLGSGPGGVLQDVEMYQRLILAGFLGLLGSGLLIVGARAWRFVSVFISLLFLGGLAALIFLNPVYKTPSSKGSSAQEIPKKSDSSNIAERSKNPEEELKQRVNYAKIQEVIDTAGNEGDGVIAIYVEQYRERYRPVLLSYFQRKFSLLKDQIPDVYSRNDDKDLLMIFTGIDLTFDDIAQHVELLGSTRTYPDLRLIELQLSSRHFQDPTEKSFKQLTDPYHPNFSGANFQELGHIDLFRAKSAVERIDLLPEDVVLSYKPRIINELLRLLGDDNDPELLSSIGHALMTWDGGTPEIANQAGEILLNKGETEMPASLIEYLLKGKAPQAVALIDAQWAKNPIQWSSKYEALGRAGEDRLIYHLKSSPKKLQKSAVEILRKVGSSKSLSPLRALEASSDSDLKASLERAIDAIHKRK